MSEHAYRKTLDNLLEGFQILDFEFTYLYVNPAAAAHGRRTPEELVGRRMHEVYPGVEHTPLYHAMLRCLNDRVAVSLENLFTFPDYTRRWFELRMEPVPDGICVHSVDIHDRKTAQTTLMQVNADLESLVKARTRELELANRELEAFSYSVSHDLRTPLRALNGFAYALAEDYSDRLDSRGLNYLERIRKASQRMDEMIQGMLLLAKIAGSALHRTPVNLSSMALDVADEIGSGHADRQVTWRIAEGLRAECDPVLARVVLDNLLGNAFKFSARTSSARIELCELSDEPGSFAVIDNGAGFDMRFVDRLFTPFQRLHDASEYQGTGIGLATVQRIVDKHGGLVRARSVPGEGTTVTFRFAPAARP